MRMISCCCCRILLHPPPTPVAVPVSSVAPQLKKAFASSSSLSSLTLQHKHRICIIRSGVAAAAAKYGSAMTVVKQEEEVEIEIRDGKLVVRGGTVLSDVPANVELKKSPTGMKGVFMGATKSAPAPHDVDTTASTSHHHHRHVFPLGNLRDLRFMCCFRFKLWWMTQRMGTCGRHLPPETQFLLVESHNAAAATSPLPAPADDAVDISRSNFAAETQHLDPILHSTSGTAVYTVFLPLLDGPFRASLQGNAHDDNLELCLDTGDTSVRGDGSAHSLFLHCGNDPFQVIEEAVQTLEKHMQTFRSRKQKEMPGILDWFGWCTWDAFYTDVSADSVKEGLTTLMDGGTPARFVIIDDGWQSVAADDKTKVPGVEAARRLTDIKENDKFRQKDGEAGLRHVVKELKEKHKLKYVYVWHAITGYWGGIQKDAAEMGRYDGQIGYPVHTHGVLANDPTIEMDVLTINGLGLVHPDKLFQFYDELHGYLAEAGVDGVKVDVQNIVETLGEGMGGRVAMTRHYQRALEASVAKNLNGHGHGCIACMSHNTDGLYSIRATPIVRASDDFWPQDPASHTIHLASVAYNSLFLGEFMQPDWDMFHSLHPAGEYHAAARAIGGCPLYVSDKPGQHNFALLKKLVFSDGSVLRCELPGRATRDCLFSDPTRDGKSLLKIWNVNKHTGVVGVFNCQGAVWCKEEKKNVVYDPAPPEVSGRVSASDVNALAGLATDGWTGDCAIYSHRGAELVRLPKDSTLPITLRVLEYEIFTISPVKKLAGSGVDFAPIGLLQMLNSGGAIRALEYGEQGERVEMRVQGEGELGAYASARPAECWVNGEKTEFRYEGGWGLVKVSVKATKTAEEELTEGRVVFTFERP